MHVEVEEDTTSRRILQRGNRSVDLGEWFITHSGSLSTADADGQARGVFLAPLFGLLAGVHRSELLHVLMLPDFDRADRIGAYWGNPGIRVERGEAQCLRLPRRSFQDE